MSRAIFDSHSHIDAPEFDPDRELVIRRAEAAGVTREEIVSFASQYDPQPMHLDEAAGAADLHLGRADRPACRR